MKQLRVGLIGYGRIGSRHAEIIHNKKIENLRLICSSETNFKKREEFKNNFNLNVYEDYLDMLQKEDIDIVSICTESGNHAQHVIKCAGKVSNIVVEKPMALSVMDAQKMISVCKEKNTNLFVVKQNRFNLPISKVRDIFEKGYFGNIFLGTVRVRWSRSENYYNLDDWRGTWALDGGVIANQASHHVDVLEWFLGKPVSVFATGSKQISVKECEDTCAAIIKFESGAIGIVEATTATKPKDLEGSFSLLGEKGTAVVSGFALNKLETLELSETNLNLDKDQFNTNPPDVYGFGHIRFYEDVVRSILENKQGLINGEEGLKSVTLISAIYESMEKNREISLSNLGHHSKLGIINAV